MQTFPSMRRSSTHKTYLKISFWIFLVIYVSITDIIYYLPPLFGIIYVLAQEHYENEEFNIFYFLVPFCIFFEASKGFPFLSIVLFMAFSFKIILPRFRKLFGYHKAFIPLFIFYAYFGYFGFLYLFRFFYEVPSFSWLLLSYAIYESILVWLFLWIIE